MPMTAVPKRMSVLRTNAASVFGLGFGGLAGGAPSATVSSGMRAGRRFRCEDVRGHRGLGGYPTEAPIARLERLDRREEIGLGPVGPEPLGEVELRVRRAPE